MASRTAVVTGAGGSIGRLVVAELGRRSYDVLALDLVGDGDRVVGCDVTDETAVAAAVAGVDRVDALVLCAGLSAIGTIDDHGVDIHRKVMEGTHFSAVVPLLALLPALRRARGRVVVVGSVAGFAPVLGRPAYVAAKHAVTGLFTTLRPELAADGVGVTIVHPTFVTGGMGVAGARGTEGRTTTGEELSPAAVARSIADAAESDRDVVLLGRTARLAWIVNRHAPRVFARAMRRRLRAGTGGQR